jgi:hypothetical protein
MKSLSQVKVSGTETASVVKDMGLTIFWISWGLKHCQQTAAAALLSRVWDPSNRMIIYYLEDDFEGQEFYALPTVSELLRRARVEVQAAGVVPVKAHGATLIDSPRLQILARSYEPTLYLDGDCFLAGPLFDRDLWGSGWSTIVAHYADWVFASDCNELDIYRYMADKEHLDILDLFYEKKKRINAGIIYSDGKEASRRGLAEIHTVYTAYYLELLSFRPDLGSNASWPIVEFLLTLATTSGSGNRYSYQHKTGLSKYAYLTNQDGDPLDTVAKHCVFGAGSDGVTKVVMDAKTFVHVVDTRVLSLFQDGMIRIAPS